MLSVVVPCFNEAEVIWQTHGRLVDALSRLNDIEFEIVYVDDASREVAACYGLELANVWWTCPPDATPILARVDAWAWDSALGRRLDVVAAALVEWCRHRIGEPT